MRFIASFTAIALLLLAGCGGGNDSSTIYGSSSSSSSSSSSGSASSTPTSSSASNTTAITVDSGPTGGSFNQPFISIKVCYPGSTTNCQTIDHVEVDTGSYGLRIISSVLTLSLPAETVSGNSLYECTIFGDGYTWGPMVTADIYISGETASSVPVNIMGGSSYSVPTGCSSASTGSEEDTVSTFYANAIIGIGPLAQDCGSSCASNAYSDAYYTCTSSGCTASTAPTSEQATNPIIDFTTDNNGAIVEMESISASGASSATGTLVFGIGTESNNTLDSSATKVVLNDSDALMEVSFNGKTATEALFDSGTNLFYFEDSSLTVCSNDTAFYCPSSTQSISATVIGTNSNTSSVTFSIESLNSLLSSAVAANDDGGPSDDTNIFILGIPYFYGRYIYYGIEGQGSNTDPYVAYN